ncbi:MAG: hypothetical protein AAGA99_17135 [Actinomycetota bacterium]
MQYDGPPVEILVINGFDDAHRITEERMRLRRLGNTVAIVEGVDAGLEAILTARDAGRLPGLVMVDVDTEDSERFLDSIRRASDLADLPIVVLGDGAVRADLRPGSTTIHVPRPAGFADIMAGIATLRSFHFDVEMREEPMRYEAWMWLRHPRVADLTDATADAADRSITA